MATGAMQEYLQKMLSEFGCLDFSSLAKGLPISYVDSIVEFNKTIPKSKGAARIGETTSILLEMASNPGEMSLSWFENNITSITEYIMEMCLSYAATSDVSSWEPWKEKNIRKEKGSVTWDVNELPAELFEDKTLFRDFVTETNDNLESLEQSLMALEENPENRDVINEIFIFFHNIKGASGFLNLVGVNRVCHVAESYLDSLREGEQVITGWGTDLLLLTADVLRRFMDSLLEVYDSGQTKIPQGFDCCGELKKVHDQLESLKISPQGTGDSSNRPESDSDFDSLESTSSGSSRSQASKMVKVEVSKLDSLIDMVGELVIAQALVTENRSAGARKDYGAMKHMGQLEKIVKDIQHASLGLRMVPIRQTFQKMKRLVRDLSSKMDKELEFRISGEDTELDKNVIEKIYDPLVHMIRNALDHGIESRNERESSGKNPVSTLSLKAYHQGGNIILELEDDGKGMDTEKLLSKAIEKGIVPAGSNPDSQEILGYIFHPGFSMAKEITSISGRGVGMDVVHQNIKQLGGSISIESETGRGSLFRIQLPLTLAIMDGMAVEVGDQSYLVPVLNIKESVCPIPGQVKTVAERGEVMTLRGEVIEVVRLSEVFEIKPISEKPEDGIIMIIDWLGKPFGILVDRIAGQHQVVIKSLKQNYSEIEGISGCSIMGNGQVGLILDVKSIHEMSQSAYDKREILNAA